MVVFAINDRTSFARAVDMLYRVRKREKDQCAIILVANKGDLVRSRHITSEGENTATVTPSAYTGNLKQSIKCRIFRNFDG